MNYVRGVLFLADRKRHCHRGDRADDDAAGQRCALQALFYQFILDDFLQFGHLTVVLLHLQKRITMIESFLILACSGWQRKIVLVRQFVVGLYERIF